MITDPAQLASLFDQAHVARVVEIKELVKQLPANMFLTKEKAEEQPHLIHGVFCIGSYSLVELGDFRSFRIKSIWGSTTLVGGQCIHCLEYDRRLFEWGPGPETGEALRRNPFDTVALQLQLLDLDKLEPRDHDIIRRRLTETLDRVATSIPEQRRGPQS